MPHTRAGKRAALRGQQANFNQDDFYYRGEDCSCGERLYSWLIPKNGGESLRLGWPFLMSQKMVSDYRTVICHSAEDAMLALAGTPTEHDSYLILGEKSIPRPAHEKPCGAVLVADFTQMGSFGEGLRDTFLQDIFAECRIEQSILELRRQLWHLLPGDFFIGHLCSMMPNGVWLDDEAISFIEQLEDDWLPSGAKAILVMTIPFGQAVRDTIELCLGRIRLYDGEVMNMPQMIAEMRFS